MTRSVAVCVAAVLAVGASAAVARAEGTLPNGADITFERVFITESGALKEPSTPDALRKYFNLAHCVCSQSNAGAEQSFDYELKTAVDTGLSKPVDLWLGANCNDNVQRPMTCIQVTSSIDDVDNLLTPDHVSIGVYNAVNAKTAGACRQEVVTTLAWAMVDTDGNGEYDYWKTQEIPKTMALQDAAIDTQAPPLPTNFSASGGEGSIQITWEVPEGRQDDYFVFQALCAKADDSAAKTKDLPGRKYETPSNLCAAALALDLTATDLPPSDTDMPVNTAPPAFAAVDEKFLCGEQSSATATNLDISGLENGTPYKVALLAIDRAGNVAGTYFTRTITPEPVIDFWEDLNDRHPEIQGGCLLAETYGDANPITRALRAFRDDTLATTGFGRWLIDGYYGTLGTLGASVHGSLALRIVAAIALSPLVVIALAWHALTLPGLLLVLALPWLCRRGRRYLRLGLARHAAAAAVAVVCLVPRLGHADDFTPYWEDPSADAQAAEDAADDVKWHAGIRVGPYIPDVDLQVGLNATTGLGPYAAMFGDYVIDGKVHEQKVYQIMPMLDVDRVLWDGFGQVAVGGSIGYMQKTGNAYLDVYPTQGYEPTYAGKPTTEDDARRPRSPTSKNTFRLLPLAALASYRFTYLDDRWGIPVVPYAKGGLSYYAWWMTAPNGEVGKACPGTTNSMCDPARGGSLGFQGSIGLAVRAERADADAARSMRNSGIQHAGFYAELYWAKVDGFGSSSRLSVGDTTWFAGVDFEF